MLDRKTVRERDDLIPQSVKEIFVPALKFGAFVGPVGLCIGGVGGVLRSSTPILFALISGVQWFTLGSTFYATRGLILRYYYVRTLTPEDFLHASIVAGGISGATIGGLTRGRRNFLPALIMFSLFGWAGQSLYNKLDARNTRRVQASNSLTATGGPPNILQKLASMKYSPMKILSDAEYETMLQEKLLHVDAEIALLDEKIDMVTQETENGETAVNDARKKVQ